MQVKARLRCVAVAVAGWCVPTDRGRDTVLKKWRQGWWLVNWLVKLVLNKIVETFDITYTLGILLLRIQASLIHL